MTGADLFRFTAAPGQGAGFIARLEGGLVHLEPITASAGQWLQDNIGDESTWIGDTLIIEERFFPDIADAIMAAGFLFERTSLPN
jgi:hypothetical protein